MLIKTVRQSRRQLYEINIWPGFVDILGTILIVTIFTVLISTITQIYLMINLKLKEVKYHLWIIRLVVYYQKYKLYQKKRN